MPSATRNTNANSGNDWSAPAKWKTWVNTNPHTPRVAANDSTTVAISSSGASSARSSSGEHHEDDHQHDRDDQVPVVPDRGVCTSRVVAVLPPTSASAPGTACTAVAQPLDRLERGGGVVGVGEGRVDDDAAVDRRHLQLSAAGSR